MVIVRRRCALYRPSCVLAWVHSILLIRRPPVSSLLPASSSSRHSPRRACRMGGERLVACVPLVSRILSLGLRAWRIRCHERRDEMMSRPLLAFLSFSFSRPAPSPRLSSVCLLCIVPPPPGRRKETGGCRFAAAGVAAACLPVPMPSLFRFCGSFAASRLIVIGSVGRRFSLSASSNEQ